MTDDSTSPVDAHRWPTRLPAHVVAPDHPPRVHGFDLTGDLAQNYDFGEFVVTALTGTPPSNAWGVAVNMALIALGAAGVERASVHAATVARRCGADDASVLATGALGLAEEAVGEVSPRGRPPTEEGRAFFESLPTEVRMAIEGPNRATEDLALSILEGAGLTTRLQRMAAVCLAKLPTLVAEVSAVRRGDVQSYPMKLPRFSYEDSSSDDE